MITIKNFKKAIGNHCEDIAANYLVKNNYKILTKNFRTKCGEIDIICQKNNTIIVIEVKGRYFYNYGAPCESVNIHKQRHIINTAKIYLQLNHLLNTYVRFDIIEILLNNDNNCNYRINHLKDAFRLNS